MARFYTAYLQREQVPPHALLQAAIKHLGFKLNLDNAYTPFGSPAYLPCDIEGEDGGFNIRFDGIALEPPAPPAVNALLDARDVSIKLSWGGDTRERLCVLIVCAALASEFGAVIHDGEKDGVATAEELQKRARTVLEEL